MFAVKELGAEGVELESLFLIGVVVSCEIDVWRRESGLDVDVGLCLW